MEQILRWCISSLRSLEKVSIPFTARFLYAWPSPKPFERPTARLNEALIAHAFERLSHCKPIPDGNTYQGEQRVIPFTDNAAQILVTWRKKVEATESQHQGIMLSFMGKCAGTVVRLAGVMTYLDWLADGDLKEEPSEIPAECVQRSISLVEDYFIPMARRCFNDAALPQEQRDALALAKWISKEQPARMNARDLGRRPDVPVKDSRRMEAALEVLCNANWVRFVGGRSGEAKGRSRKDYEINPSLYDNSDNSDNSSPIDTIVTNDTGVA